MDDYNKISPFPTPCTEIKPNTPISEVSYIDKCECHIHSLDGNLAVATILKKVGDNKYLADYNGVQCTAIFNPFAGKYYVDDKYGIVSSHKEHGRGR